MSSESIDDPLKILHLPHEIIIEILSRLPVKSVLKFRCVSKSWRSLISDPHFIKKHLHKSTTNDNYTNHRVILNRKSIRYYPAPGIKGSTFHTCSLDSIYKKKWIDPIDLDGPFGNPRHGCQVIGSCNGLLCVKITQKSLLLWNPAINEIRVLPEWGIQMNEDNYHPRARNHLWRDWAYGFGYDKTSDDYKVVVVLRSMFSTTVGVYSLRTNSWKIIQAFPHGYGPPVDGYLGRLVSGDLIWQLQCFPGCAVLDAEIDFCGCRKVIGLDLASETYKEVPLPHHCDIDPPKPLGILRECLCVMDRCGDTHYDVWVMKEYGVRESWTKLFTIPCWENQAWGNIRFTLPIHLSHDGEILVQTPTRFDICNTRDNTLRCPVFRSQSFNLASCIYIESLVSPNAEHMEEATPIVGGR